MGIVQIDATVVENKPLVAGHYQITIDCPEIAAAAKPGSFVEVLASECYGSIIRKPFSIFNTDPETGYVSIIYQLKGATTIGMAAKVSGETLNVVGPLGGRVFEIAPRPNVRHIAVGGGYGAPPLVFLAKSIVSADPTAHVDFVVGARSKDRLICTEEATQAGANVLVSTDDGSFGVKGLVVDILNDIVDQNAVVYCCGPTPMMAAVAKLCADRNATCWVSLEVSMACGLGVCMGCVIDLRDGRRVRACKEGPVFDGAQVVWAK
jgi:dihydroorotate dehydrogenase electron transfer subunit